MMINLNNMWVLLVIISVFLNASYCSNPLQSAPAKRTSKSEVLDPNVFPSTAPSLKGSSDEVPHGFGSSRAVSQVINSAGSVMHHLIVRRFVNLLLKKAYVKNSEGINVPLQGVSNLEHGELKMTIALTANSTEIEILKEFGLKRKNLTLQQIDELITNLFTTVSSSPSRDYDCPVWPWRELWDELIYKIDPIKVIYVLIFLCLMWILVRTIRGKNSWITLVLGITVSSFVMEYVRMFQEETIKQHSEQIRRGNIPDYCLGEGKQTWLQYFFGGNEEDECHQYHIYQHGNPLLRVSLLKVFLSQIQLFIDPFVNSFRNLAANYKGDWFYENIIYRSLIVGVLGICAVVLIVIKFGGVISLPFFISIKGDKEKINKGSHVQSLPLEDTAKPVRPPPRKKSGSKKKETDCIDFSGGSSTPTIIVNVKSDTFNLNPSTFNNQHKERKAITGEKEKKCPFCRDDSVVEAVTEKENCTSSEDGDKGYTETELKSNVHSITGTDAKNNKCHNFAYGDTSSVID